MNYVVESRNGWQMIRKETFWMIKRPIVSAETASFVRCHTGSESYIRKLWKENYRPWSQNM